MSAVMLDMLMDIGAVVLLTNVLLAVCLALRYLTEQNTTPYPEEEYEAHFS